MNRPSILVIGVDGMIGRALLRHFDDGNHRIIGTSRHALDLVADPATWDLPGRIDVAYMLAGITSMAACETDPEGTRKINVTNSIALMNRLAQDGAHIVYVSSNLVLAGDQPMAGPHSIVAPQCVYAAQKAEIEQYLLTTSPPGSVLRITKIAESLIALMAAWARALQMGEIIRPFRDMVAAPLPLALVVQALAQIGIDKAGGLYQLSANPDLSYADIARLLAFHMKADSALVQPVNTDAEIYARPAHTTLDSTTTAAKLGLGVSDSIAGVAALMPQIMALV